MAWRAMTEADLDAVRALADAIHPGYPEDGAVLAERLRLYPAGCFVWVRDGAARGYALSHPWPAGAPPALNTRIGAIPADADAYHLHDIALLASERGRRAGSAIVARLAAHARAQGFRALTLIAVNRSGPFWERAGFVAQRDAGLRATLASYGTDAVYMRAAVA